MTVLINETPGADYAWSAAGFSWDAVESGKSWAAAHVALVDVVADDLVPFAEGGGRHTGTRAASMFGVAEARLGEALADRHEGLALAETYVDYINFILLVAESLVLGESAGKTADRPDGDAFGFVDAASRRPVKAASETLSLADVLARTAVFQRDLAEAVSLADAAPKMHARFSGETLALADALLRHARAVLADLAVRSTPMDEAAFRALVAEKGPLGYGPFRDLVAGDYEYAKALIGLLLSAPVTGERIAVADATLNVDVPDVRDRGTASVPTTGATVAFTRSFTEPPEVQATLKAGGTPALPEITAITTTGFDVRLVDAADGATPVAGTVSWSALGY